MKNKERLEKIIHDKNFNISELKECLSTITKESTLSEENLQELTLLLTTLPDKLKLFKLTEVVIENYRNFLGITNIKFNDSNYVFIGNNGTGKTNILRAINCFLQKIYLCYTKNKLPSNSFNENDVYNNINIKTTTINYYKFTYHFSINNISYTCVDNYQQKNTPDTVKYKSVQDYVSIVKSLIKDFSQNITIPILGFYSSSCTVRTNIFFNKKSRERQLEYIDLLYNNNEKIDFTNIIFSVIYMNTVNKELLDSILTIIKNFIPDIQDIKIIHSNCRETKLDYFIENSIFIVKHDGSAFNISNLSRGEKQLLSIVLDIFIRATYVNPHCNIEDMYGLILIDEIDLFLHPSWQGEIINKLHDTFPKIQFIMTTHSPLILSSLNKNQIYRIEMSNSLHEKDNTDPLLVPTIESISEQTSGMSSNNILLDAFKVKPMDENNIYYKKLQELEQEILEKPTNNVQKKIQEIKEHYGENSEYYLYITTLYNMKQKK